MPQPDPLDESAADAGMRDAINRGPLPQCGEPIAGGACGLLPRHTGLHRTAAPRIVRDVTDVPRSSMGDRDDEPGSAHQRAVAAADPDLIDPGGVYRRTKASRAAMIGPGGHGHVWHRPDGGKARCGGPGLCSSCAGELAEAQGLFAAGLAEILPDDGTYRRLPAHPAVQIPEGPGRWIPQDQLDGLYANRERLELARAALVATGYFTSDQVGNDIAPRITELYAQVCDEDTLDSLRAQIVQLRLLLEPAPTPQETPVTSTTPGGRWIRRQADEHTCPVPVPSDNRELKAAGARPGDRWQCDHCNKVWVVGDSQTDGLYWITPRTRAVSDSVLQDSRDAGASQDDR